MLKPKVDDPTTLAPLLEQAVISGDAEKVTELMAAGASPSLGVPGSAPGHDAITPLWLALKAGKEDLVPLLLARHHSEAPLAISSPRQVSVFEQLGAVPTDQFDHMRAYRLLAGSLDFSTAAMRSAAWKMIKKSRDRFIGLGGDGEALSVAEGVVMFHATPAKISSVAVALEFPVLSVSNWSAPDVFASFLVMATGSSKLFAHWISRGLPPGTVAGGLPLLHHAALQRNADLAQVLLSAGADPRARGVSAIALTALSKARLPIAADGACTALDLATAVGAQGVAKAILAASAHGAVDQVLAQARRRTTP